MWVVPVKFYHCRMVIELELSDRHIQTCTDNANWCYDALYNCELTKEYESANFHHPWKEFSSRKILPEIRSSLGEFPSEKSLAFRFSINIVILQKKKEKKLQIFILSQNFFKYFLAKYYIFFNTSMFNIFSISNIFKIIIIVFVVNELYFICDERKKKKEKKNCIFLDYVMNKRGAHIIEG